MAKPTHQSTEPLPTSTPSNTSSLPTTQVEPLSPEPLSPAIPRWQRAHNSKSRKTVAKILVLKMSGLKGPEIAKRLKTTEGTVRHYMWLAGKNGWLGDDRLSLVDPSEDLAFNAAHKVVRNIHDALDGKSLKEQQFTMTVETAKGIGLFKTHQATKVEGAISIPSLEVNITMPATQAATALPVDESAVGGSPAYLEAVLEGDSK